MTARTRRVLRKRAAVPAPSPQSGEQVEREPLHPKRHEGEVHLVQVLVEENRDLKQRPRGEPRQAHAAVPLQAEEDAQPFLAAARWTELDQVVRLVGAGVREAVRHPRRDDEDAPGPERPAPSPDAEAQLAGDTLEALPLARVDVRRHEATRTDEELAGDASGRPPVEDDALAAHGILDRVYHLLDHLI